MKFHMIKMVCVVISLLFMGVGAVPGIADTYENVAIHSDFWEEGLYPHRNCDFLKISECTMEHDVPSLDDAQKIDKNVQPCNTKKWTWMFYDDADFYRAYDPLEDFSEEAFSNEYLDILVLQDKEYGPAKIWYVDETHNTDILENVGEVNMGDAQTLQDFVTYAKDHYPAERYILSFYDHGGGWSGVCWDDTSIDHLTMDEVQYALLNTGGVDIVCHTAPCLMGAIESAYELRACTEVYIGSEELSGYGHWWGTIGKMCDKLNDNPEITNDDFGKFVIQSLWDTTPWPDAITMSAVNTTNLEALVSSCDCVAKEFISSYNESYDLFWSIYPTMQRFGDGFCIDAYDLAAKCSNGDFNQQILHDLMALMDCFSEVIIDECHGDYPGAHGLSIYVPDPSKYSYSPQYGQSSYGLDFAQNTNWDEFLALYCGERLEPGVDQYQTDSTTGMVACSLFVWAQSFIPSEDVLTKVHLKLARVGQITSDLTVSIRKDTDGTDLTTVTIPYERVPTDTMGWVTFNFPTISLSTGEPYYILLSTDGGDNSANYYLWGSNTNSGSYPYGDVWICWPSNAWEKWNPPIDACFKTFFLESALNPPTITGPSEGKPGITYNYTLLAEDPDGLDVSYYVDWGDGSTSAWTGPYPSGTQIFFTHTWATKGTYTVKAKVKNLQGNESDWSYLSVTMPHSYNIRTAPFFKLLYQWFPPSFPLLRQVIEEKFSFFFSY